MEVIVIVTESPVKKMRSWRLFSGFASCLFLVLLPIAGAGGARVQAQVRLLVLPESDFRIEGRSNQSDFEVHSTVITGWLELSDADDPLSVTGLSLTVPSEGIKSDQGLIMNRIMYGSLDVDKHPNITFEMVSAWVPDVVSDSLNLVVNGLLTLTGTTKEVALELLAASDSTGSSHYVGSFPLTMTDFGMETPSLMFGQLRVHRDIQIHFDLFFGPESEE